jgi:hypothetical protein
LGRDPIWSVETMTTRESLRRRFPLAAPNEARHGYPALATDALASALPFKMPLRLHLK